MTYDYLAVCHCGRQTMICYSAELDDYVPVDSNWIFGKGWTCGGINHVPERVDHSIKELPEYVIKTKAEEVYFF
jgi:hypothetical protein